MSDKYDENPPVISVKLNDDSVVSFKDVDALFEYIESRRESVIELAAEKSKLRDINQFLGCVNLKN